MALILPYLCDVEHGPRPRWVVNGVGIPLPRCGIGTSKRANCYLLTACLESLVNPVHLIHYGELDPYGICDCRAVHRDERRCMCGRVPRGLHPSQEGRKAV